jgi:hypothetical protein
VERLARDVGAGDEVGVARDLARVLRIGRSGGYRAALVAAAAAQRGGGRERERDQAWGTDGLSLPPCPG